MMRVIEVITSFPSLLITLLIMMVVGQNVGGLLFAMCITSCAAPPARCAAS